MASSNEKYELPEICYDEPQPGHQPNPFPFILVKKDKKMPPVLFIEERKETGEIEPGPNGEPQEIVDSLMHKFVDMEVLKEKLPPHLNDIVRVALGMKPLKEAAGSGQAVLDKVHANAEKIKADLLKRAADQKTKKDNK
jgi:hypothetical protein